MKRCVIVGAAPINNYDRILSYIKNDDYIIYCDAGYKHYDKIGRADLLVGDFDSSQKPSTDIETIVLPVKKDDTDTVYAVKEAIRRGFNSFLLIGVIGLRLDHSLGNLSILTMLADKGLSGKIVDDYSEMEVISGCATVSDEFSYFSLLALSSEAKGVFIENALYPLDKATITNNYPYGISNEVLPGKTATITVEAGSLLLVRVFDT